MAGRGPAPKDPDERARTNAPARGEWVDVYPPKTPILPTLASVEKGEWEPRAQSMWDAWRKDPATTLFGPAEIAAAIHTIYLVDELVAGGSVSLVTQVRLHMDGLGLTLKGKRDLRLRVASEDHEAQGSRRPSSRDRYADLVVLPGGQAVNV